MRKLEDIVLRNADRPARLTLVLVAPLAAVFVLIAAAFYMWDHQNRHRLLELQLKETARAHLEQIALTRLWNAGHGGVYVEVTEDTPPNPYLEDPEKTIVSTGGKVYTKLNPAYMTRQISELIDKHRAFKIRLTGLDPRNPANKPDEWEEEMLRRFREGQDEGYGLMKYLGKDYFRYIAPLYVAEDCLRCHAKEGYRVGDVKGGISVSIPSVFLADLLRDLDRRSLLAFAAIGVAAVSLLAGTTWSMSRRLAEGLRSKLEGEKLRAAVQVAAAAAHELRQPMTIISGFSELMKEKAAKGEDASAEAEIITGQCYRMNEIITRMLNVTAYRTKVYAGETEIFDLNQEKEEQR